MNPRCRIFVSSILAGFIIFASACGGGGAGGDLVDGGCGTDPPGPASLVGFDTATGDEAWQRPVGAAEGAATLDGAVVVRGRSVMRGYDSATGALRWCARVSAPSSPDRTTEVVTIADQVAILTGADLATFDAVSGAERWRVPIDGSEAGLIGGPYVWVTDRGAQPGLRFVFDVDGQALDQVPLPPPSASAPGFAPAVRQLAGFTLHTESRGGDGAPDPADETRQELSVRVATDTGDAWMAVVPGFVAALAPHPDGVAVVVIDQTGGTGVIGDRARSQATAYAAGDGRELWTTPLEGTPSIIHGASDALLVIPDGSSVIALDSATGTEVWSADHGSPGRGGQFSAAGSYRLFGGDGSVVAGLIVAERPYTD